MEARPEVASNPTVLPRPRIFRRDPTALLSPPVRWAQLFNLRYRDSAHLPDAQLPTGSAPRIRANLASGGRASQGICRNVQPQGHFRHPGSASLTAFRDSQRAGPPFEMPFRLTCPEGESGGWHLYSTN